MYIPRTIVFILLTFLAHQTFAQVQSEIYYKYSDYTAAKFDTTTTLSYELRTQGDIFMSGGNDYRIKSSNYKLKSMIKNDAWGLKIGDSLFINCFPQKLGMLYAYATPINDKLIFSAGIPLTKDMQSKMALTAYALGPIGGGIASGKQAQKRYYYLLDPKDGSITYVSKDVMLTIIHDADDLIGKYNLEKEPEKKETIKKYLDEYAVLKNQ